MAGTATQTLPFGFDEATPSVRLRVIRDLWDVPPPWPLVREVLGQPEVVALARSQRRDGTWASWLHHSGSSTENAVTRLAELGCVAEQPPLAPALPRLLAFLKNEPAPFVDLRRPGSTILLPTRLRRVAAGLLCQVGFAQHKVVREAVEHELDRAYRWALHARSEGIGVRVERSPAGRRDLVYDPAPLDSEGLPVPDLYWLRGVAFSRDLRGDPRVREVLRMVARPEYQELADAGLGVLEVDGQRIRPGFGIRRSEPERAADERRLGELLVVAELCARCGDPGPARKVLRFLEMHADSGGRVRLSRRPFRCVGGYAIQRSWVRLATPWRKAAREIDLTFRRLLLERLVTS